MSVRAVTSFGPKGYHLYGKRCIESFRRFWPKEIELLVYGEGPGDWINLWDVKPFYQFIARHVENEYVRGRKPWPGTAWKPKALAGGYNYRFDAWKFCRKVFAIADAARRQPNGKLFWIDADTETFKPVPAALLHELLPAHVSICHLARPGKYSECGFVGYNLDRQETRDFVAAFERVYAADEFFAHREWHDSFLFDRLLEQLQPVTKQIPHTDNSTPFDHSVLGQTMRHYKGARTAKPLSAA